MRWGEGCWFRFETRCYKMEKIDLNNLIPMHKYAIKSALNPIYF